MSGAQRILTAEDALALKDAERRAGDGGEGKGLLMMVSTKDIQVQADAGIIKGYANLYNVFDDYNEILRPGVFARSIKDDFDKPPTPRIKVLLQHDWGAPVGLPTVMREDSKGLYVEAHLTDATPEGQRARVLAREGLMDGLSVGLYRRKGGWRELGEDEFKAEKLPSDPMWWWPTEVTDADLVEFSLVTFPANWGSRVSSYKALSKVFQGWRPAQAQAQAEVKATEEAEQEAVLAALKGAQRQREVLEALRKAALIGG